MQVPKDVQDAVGKLIEKLGVEKGAEFLQLTNETALRLMTGQPVRPASVNLARARLKLKV
jgi:hypothetical protein